MLLTSSAFGHNDNIPAKYTCEGDNVSPPLNLRDVPRATRSLVLMLDDPDMGGEGFVHWLVYDIVPGSRIREGLVNGTVGVNDFSRPGYVGPCPPLGEIHRYVFRLFALDQRLGIEHHQQWEQVQTLLNGRTLARAELVVLYRRTKQSMIVPDYEGDRSDKFLHWVK